MMITNKLINDIINNKIVKIKDYEISIKNNTDFMFIHPSNSNYKWYMSHSRTSDEAIMSLSNKIR